jgi:hypothetical protein
MKATPADTLPALEEVRTGLERIVRLLESVPADRWPAPLVRELALRLLDQLLKLTARTLKNMKNAEIFESQAVYGAVARELSKRCGFKETDVYRAVIALCEKGDNPALTDGLPELEPLVAERLSRLLMQITVTYEPEQGDRDTPRRIVRAVYGEDMNSIKHTESVQSVVYERLPGPVRDKLIKDGTPVRFQLFPRRA